MSDLGDYSLQVSKCNELASFIGYANTATRGRPDPLPKDIAALRACAQKEAGARSAVQKDLGDTVPATPGGLE